MAKIESATQAGVTVTLVRADAPGVLPAKWYESRRYDQQWFDVFVSRVAGEQGDKVGGIERARPRVGPKPTTAMSLGGPLTRRQFRQFRWRYFTDDYKPAGNLDFADRRTALEDLLRNTPALSGLQRADLKALCHGFATRR